MVRAKNYETESTLFC